MPFFSWRQQWKISVFPRPYSIMALIFLVLHLTHGFSWLTLGRAGRLLCNPIIAKGRLSAARLSGGHRIRRDPQGSWRSNSWAGQLHLQQCRCRLGWLYWDYHPLCSMQEQLWQFVHPKPSREWPFTRKADRAALWFFLVSQENFAGFTASLGNPSKPDRVLIIFH